MHSRRSRTGSLAPSEADDAFWARAARTNAGGQTLDVVCDLLVSALFERFPRLEILRVESSIGRIPTLLEQSDDRFRRYR